MTEIADAWTDPKLANILYHDWEASTYDEKWSISYDERCIDYARDRFVHVAGDAQWPYGRVLEIGAGTGYFSLHMQMAGLVGRATCTDISGGMIEVLQANATVLELDVETEVCDAEELPFEDGSFDLVFGHAVLHHIPDLARAFAEFRRVLAPGGMIVFAGEPSRYGDRLAQVPKVAATAVAPAWRAAIGAGAAPEGHADGGEDNHELERHVDVHAFLPADLERAAGDAGFVDVRVTGEELLANWFGWTNRALEHTAVSDEIPDLWRQYAFRGYLALQKVDRSLLEGRLPATVFYNLLLSARRPG